MASPVARITLIQQRCMMASKMLSSRPTRSCYILPFFDGRRNSYNCPCGHGITIYSPARMIGISFEGSYHKAQQPVISSTWEDNPRDTHHNLSSCAKCYLEMVLIIYRSFTAIHFSNLITASKPSRTALPKLP